MSDGPERWSRILVIAIAAVSLVGCDHEPSAGQGASDEVRGDHAARTASKASGHGRHAGDEQPPASHHGSATHSPKSADSPSPTPHEKLQSMDERRPVPLLPQMAHHQKQNMRDHLVAVREIAAAAGKRDFEAIREAAEPIGSSPEMKQMCRHMGAGADGFTERALEFHKKADGIIESAKSEDLTGVFDSLSATLQTCTSCHSTYKQKVVSPEAWEETTGMASPSGSGGMHHR